MSQTFRAAAQASGANSTTTSQTIPAGSVIGDVALALWIASSAQVLTYPVGWKIELAVTNPGSTTLSVLSKPITPGVPGSTVTFTTSGTSRQVASVAVYSDVDTVNPIDAIASSLEGVSQVGHLMPTVNTVRDNCVAISMVGERLGGTTASTWTPPAGYTERTDNSATGGGGASSTEISDLLTQVAGGTTLGGGTATASVAGATAVMVTISLAPKRPAVNNNYQFVKAGDGISVSEKLR